MSIYSLVLIFHVIAVFVLCAALTIEALSLVHLRGASTRSEVSPWIAPAPTLHLFALAAVIVIAISGFYLVASILPSGHAWSKVAVVSLLFMGPLGAVTGRRLRAIRKAYKAGKASNSELLDQLQDPFLKVSLCIRIAFFFGIFLLVSSKPRLWESVGLMGFFLVAGLASALLPWRHSRPLSAPSAELGD